MYGRTGCEATSTIAGQCLCALDSKARRRLPINDVAHVRNALARFNRVVFADEAARERARLRVLNAARRHGIVPIGFMIGQLRSERYQIEKLAIENERLLGQVAARATEIRLLPTGLVTFLLADIESSTGLVARLGDRYATLLNEVRRLVRHAPRRHALLSLAARDALGAPVGGITLLSLGSHQLHGLPDPEELFQVFAADLLSDFPPPRTLMLART